MSTVRILLGDGQETEVEVSYFSEFLRGPNGSCAFCDGDIDGEVMRDYFATRKWAQSCPVCDGRPT